MKIRSLIGPASNNQGFIKSEYLMMTFGVCHMRPHKWGVKGLIKMSNSQQAYGNH